MGVIISDREWNEFINDNFVCEDVIEVIAIRITFTKELTDRELAIYKEHSDRIENKIKELNLL